METKQTFFQMIAEWGPVIAVRESIRNKLMVSLLTLSLIPLLFLGIVAYVRSSEALMQNAFENLKMLESARADAIQNFFQRQHSNMRALNQSVRSVRAKAFKQLASVQQLKKRLIEGYFNERLNNVRFLSASPLIISALKAFETEPARSPAWKSAEAVYGDYLVRICESYGFYDVYLISDKGDICYTVAQASDLGENLRTDVFRESSAGKAFEKGLNGVSFQDFETYEPAYGDIAAFVTAPIRDNGETIGVIMLQISVDQMNYIMQESTGLGQSGESYLVGPDGLFRSDSIHIEESTVMNPAFVVDTKGTSLALAGETGQGMTINFRGEYVLSSWTPVRVYDQTWAMIGEIELTEAFISKEEGDERDIFSKYKEEYGYENISLINPDGFMFFTLVRRDDYHTNMLTGPYKDTNLGRLIKKVSETGSSGMSDFERYPPVRNQNAAFVAMPVRADTQETEVIVIAQLSVDQISTVMSDRIGLGKTGETYLVGPDKMFRSESVFLNQMEMTSVVMNPEIRADTVAVRKALAGNKGTQVIRDYRGVKVLSSWSSVMVSPPNSVNPDGIRWAVIAQTDYKEVIRPVTNMILTGSLLIMIVICVVLASAFMLSHNLTVQVKHITHLIEQIGMGNFDARTPVTTRDELGTMALSLNAMLDNLVSLIRNR